MGAPGTWRRGLTVLSVEAPKSPSPPRPPSAFIDASEQRRTPTPIGTLGDQRHRNRPAAARHAGGCSVSLSAMEGGRWRGLEDLVPSQRDAPALQGPRGIPPTSTPSVPDSTGVNRKWAKASVGTGDLGCPEHRVARLGRGGSNAGCPWQRAVAETTGGADVQMRNPGAASSLYARSGPQPRTPSPGPQAELAWGDGSLGRRSPRPRLAPPSTSGPASLSRSCRGLPAATAGGGVGWGRTSSRPVCLSRASRALCSHLSS